MAMTHPRDEILERIRQAAGQTSQSPADDYAAVPRTYRQTGALGRAECLALFADRLAHYDAGVYYCERIGLSSTIARALEARNKRRVVIPAAVPREWLPTQCEFVPDGGITYAELDAIDGAVTSCTVAIALTGTIVLGHSPAEGRRALTLIPDYHLCVVETSQIVETVPEAFRRLAALDPRLLTTISGPSATADIEMTRIKGVHGPRTLDVVIVQ